VSSLPVTGATVNASPAVGLFGRPRGEVTVDDRIPGSALIDRLARLIGDQPARVPRVAVHGPDTASKTTSATCIDTFPRRNSTGPTRRVRRRGHRPHRPDRGVRQCVAGGFAHDAIRAGRVADCPVVCRSGCLRLGGRRRRVAWAMVDDGVDRLWLALPGSGMPEEPGGLEPHLSAAFVGRSAGRAVEHRLGGQPPVAGAVADWSAGGRRLSWSKTRPVLLGWGFMRRLGIR